MHLFKKEELDIINNILETYGSEAQCLLAMEECGELIQAINKNLRNKENARDMLVEEISDILILLKQISIIFMIENFDKKIEIQSDLLPNEFENYDMNFKCRCSIDLCAKLIIMINKNLNNKMNMIYDDRNDLIKVVADLNYIISQLCNIFNINESEIDNLISFKLNRQKERMKEENT